MKVCITGGTGFIGGPLCTALLSQGYAVKMLSRTDRAQAPGLVVTAGDLLEGGEPLLSFIEDCDVLFHCAGEIKNTDLMYDLHVHGTGNLLKAVSEKINRTGQGFHWVQLSSTGAYGRRTATSQTVVDEGFSPAPVGEYEVTKTISDELVVSFSKIEPRFTYTILRPSIVIGANMPNQSFFQLAAMVRKGLFFYIGSKQALSTYVHVNDVVRALILCATHVKARGEIFILSNDCPLSEVIESIADVYSVSKPILKVPERILRLLVRLVSPLIKLPLTNERIDELVKRTSYSSAKLKRELGFEFQQSIPSAMPELLDQFLRKSKSKAVANND
ncbi:NAD-dependent epimerase/dehydratase family protein [Pseudomonas sp. 15FMM2]|uniref:NAD-dependent epimerase/dehydratase family protein n=1 Tax=Pseudomonas imrae TaxID=2992837 RepID=A0ACC7PBT8_9PSED